MCAFACEHIIIDMPFIMRLHTGMNQGWWQWESYHYVKCWRHHHHHKKEDDEEIDKHLSPTLGLPDDTPDVQNFELRNLEAGDYHRGERGEESEVGHKKKRKKWIVLYKKGWKKNSLYYWQERTRDMYVYVESYA